MKDLCEACGNCNDDQKEYLIELINKFKFEIQSHGYKVHMEYLSLTNIYGNVNYTNKIVTIDTDNCLSSIFICLVHEMVHIICEKYYLNDIIFNYNKKIRESFVNFITDCIISKYVSYNKESLIDYYDENYWKNITFNDIKKLIVNIIKRKCE